MRNIIRFIWIFFSAAEDYDSYLFFKNTVMTPMQRKAAQEADAAKGIKPHDKNRWDYALNRARIWWRHRDRYSKKCTGECEDCKCKHC